MLLSITASVFVEIFTHTYRLSEEGFGYNYGRLKSLASHAYRENTLLSCGKIRKRVRRLQRASDIEGRGLLGQALRCVARVFYSLSSVMSIYIAGARPVCVILKILFHISRNKYITLRLS